MEIKLGTHNSMSYLRPKYWYMYPFRFIAKCQNLDIDQQLDLGIRMFDIRLSYNKDLIPEFRHGIMVFRGNVEGILNKLNNFREPIYVRLLLETHRTTEDLDIKQKYFKIDCQRWEHIYPNLKFFCGRRKFDWKQIYKFKLDDLDVDQYVSSMQSKGVFSWFPWLYAKLFNKDNISKVNTNKWSLFDFIEIK